MKIYITIIALVLFSCSKNDDFNQNGGCRLIFSDGVFVNGSVSIKPTTSLGLTPANTKQDTIVYKSHYFYNKHNQLEKRVNYTLTTNYGVTILDYDSTDSLSYDHQGRIDKLYSKNTHYYSYEYLNSSNKPNKIYHYYGLDKKLSSTENITYDDLNRIKTVKINYTPTKNSSYFISKTETEYKYQNHNLVEIETIQSVIDTEENPTTKIHKIQKFKNYDTYKNPLKNLPFINVRGISESENNYTKYTTETITSRENLPDTNSSSGDQFTDENLKYLETSKFECD
ncbi:hypothetical protein [Wenyingzhuangia aestuarii]|uniref:hypothetical protein n=1 Tax=Wenyingzhuangia aestuarii TaxID=1647582 RepID=UPI00143AF61F|nr:hypothetical protein [Wenyingzhuangia aestuarii]NJB81829.1 hypothetical protein [Wenyingzhuangia aestuarii]